MAFLPKTDVFPTCRNIKKSNQSSSVFLSWSCFLSVSLVCLTLYLLLTSLHLSQFTLWIQTYTLTSIFDPNMFLKFKGQSTFTTCLSVSHPRKEALVDHTRDTNSFSVQGSWGIWNVPSCFTLIIFVHHLLSLFWKTVEPLIGRALLGDKVTRGMAECYSTPADAGHSHHVLAYYDVKNLLNLQRPWALSHLPHCDRMKPKAQINLSSLPSGFVITETLEYLIQPSTLVLKTGIGSQVVCRLNLQTDFWLIFYIVCGQLVSHLCSPYYHELTVSQNKKCTPSSLKKP